MKPIDFSKNLVILQMEIRSSSFGHLTPPQEEEWTLFQPPNIITQVSKKGKKIKKAADYFDIKLIDHIIVSFEGYYSYAEQNSDW